MLIAGLVVVAAVLTQHPACGHEFNAIQGGVLDAHVQESDMFRSLGATLLADLGARQDPNEAVEVARLAADPQRVRYRIDIITGNAASASTESPVYLTVHGTDGDTGEFSLVAEDSPYSPLLRGVKANITKSLKDIGTITKIRLRNPSEDDWQCDTIRITKDGTSTEFKVEKWVVSPKQTTRWAYAEVEYMLMVTTGTEQLAGTEKPQFVTIYGAQGSTGEIKLGNAFERETSVEVVIKARDVGKPSYIMLHNPSDDEWYCTSIRMTTSHGSFDFSANKWVATPTHPKASVPVDKNYAVVVNTGPDFDDGTEGEIYIQLFGVAGASAVHLLSKGIQAGRKSTMDLSAKDVGRVTKIKLSTESEDGWHCKTVDIRSEKHDMVHFDVDGWVQAPMATSLSVVADIPYTIMLKTAADDKADSMGQFAVNVYGTLGVTRTLPIPADTGFNKDAVARYTLQAKDVGDLTKVRLSTRSADGWKCKDVTITKDGKAYPFSVDKWIQFPLAATVDTNVDIKYSFTIKTGSKKGADTGAMIYITLYGTRGQSRYLPLKTGFAAGSTETVTFKTQDVGYLTRIKLTSTSTDEWYCENIVVNYDGVTARFDTRKWLVYPESSNIYVDRYQE